MTLHLHQDPDRRCKPLAEWPEADRRLWLAALVPGDLLEEGGARANFTENTNVGVVYSYGRWLQWLDRHGKMAPIESPSDRITPVEVRAYLADLEQHNATQTVINRLIHLSVAAKVMGPDRDWSWIRRVLWPVQARHRPARHKRPRLVASSELFDLGLSLMDAAEREGTDCCRATTFRDGLTIAFLAKWPLRLSNLVGLTLGRTVLLRDLQWWIQIPAAETKTREPIDGPWPEDLVFGLETYLASHRPFLAERHGRWTRPVGQALWLSIDGSPMTRRGIYDRITRCTVQGLGKAINPHLFRDCAATTMALEDPEHVRVVAPLLGHRTLSTSERYYVQARNVEASRTMQAFLLTLRRGKKNRQLGAKQTWRRRKRG